MRGVKSTIAACLLAAVIGTACGDSGDGAASEPSSSTTSTTTALPAAAAHVLDVAAQIEASGIGCSDATDDTGPQHGTPGNPASEQASCTIGDDLIVISLFLDRDALEAAKPMLHEGSCFVAENPEQQEANLAYVEGENWIVYPQAETTARQVADAIHGTLRTIDC
jgi:hypothetical protein